MNGESPMMLIGVGTAGCAIARGVNRAFGGGLRHLLMDTDASSGAAGGPFMLLGGDRLSGRGAGGDPVSARLATEESIKLLDEPIEGTRLAIVVTALGGGTGSGATLEVVRHLAAHSIPAIVFATTPFGFEGDDRKRNACGIMPMIAESASASFFLPLDKLVQGEDNMAEALKRAVDTVATGVTLFWRLVEKPGYIRLDIERIRQIVSRAGRGRFASVSVQGADRATAAVDQLSRSELLASASSPVRAMVCGILCGDDLRLSEVGLVANGLRAAFGEQVTFDLGTVNDESTFSGRMAVVVMLFEAESRESAPSAPMGGRKTRKSRSTLGYGPAGRGRFNRAETTVWNGEDLDIPTFVRRDIRLDY